MSGASQEPPGSPRAPNDEPRSKRPWRVVLQAPLAAFALGPLPEPSVGLAVAGGVSFERWLFLAEGGAWLEQRMTKSDEPGIGADIQLAGVGLRTCWAAFQGRFELSPCVVLTAPHLWASGSGDHVAPRTADVTWLAPGIGALVRWRLAPWFGLVGALSGQIEASRPVIAIDGVGTLGQIGPASVTLAVGLEWIF